ncbi:MAG: GNAT family N-acetyltransferase [Anaerolineaceae bacterium]
MQTAIDYFNQDYYQNYPLIKALERGFDVVRADESGVLLVDAHPGFALLSTIEPLKYLNLISKPELMMVVGESAGALAYSNFGFENAMCCHQYYYPFPTIESDLELETASLGDLSFIAQHYALADEEELRETIENGDLWVVRDEGQILGFIGRHSEGSMGMMEVLPDYRRKGWGERLERALIKLILSEGELPYGHVVIGNEASTKLQEKLGFIRCKEIITWLW